MDKDLEITPDTPDRPLTTTEGFVNGVPFTAQVTLQGNYVVTYNGKTKTITQIDVLNLILQEVIGG